MERLLVPVACLAALVPAAGCGPSLLVQRPTSPSIDSLYTETWVHQIRSRGRSGDILVRRGYAAISDFFSVVTGDGYSHVGVYDAERGLVYEASAKRVHATPLERFVATSHKVMVVRVAGLTAAERRDIARRARATVGAAYDYGGLLGFDDPERFYCTELASWAAQATERGLAAGALVTVGDVRTWGPVLFEAEREDLTPRALASR